MPEAKDKEVDNHEYSWDWDMDFLKTYKEDPLSKKVSVRMWNEFLETSGAASASFEKIIDMGCGPGTTTEKLVTWKDIKNIEKPEELRDGAHKDKGLKNKEIVGTDVSEPAIEFCKEKRAKTLHDVFGDPVKLSYHVVDSGDPTCAFWKNEDNMEKFDLVASYMTFHWIPDQKKALQCVYSCLKPGGRLALLLCVGEKVERSQIAQRLKSTPKWEPFIKNINPVLPAWQNFVEKGLIPTVWSTSHIVDVYVKLAAEIGLKIDCKIMKEKFFYEVEYLQKFETLCAPYLKAVPEELREDLRNDLIKEICRINPPILHEGQMCIESEVQCILVCGVKKM